MGGAFLSVDNEVDTVTGDPGEAVHFQTASSILCAGLLVRS